MAEQETKFNHVCFRCLSQFPCRRTNPSELECDDCHSQACFKRDAAGQPVVEITFYCGAICLTGDAAYNSTVEDNEDEEE